MSQQRTQNNRGSLQTPNVRPVADMAWTITSVVGDVVTVTIDSDPSRLFMQSLPPFRGESPAQAVASAILTGNSLELTFPSAPDGGSAIEILSAQPGVRNNLGAYLAAGRQLTPVPIPTPPAVSETTWMAALIGPSEIEMTQALGGPDVIVNCAADFTLDGLGGVCIGLSISGPHVVLEFAGAIALGDTLTISPTGLTNGFARWVFAPGSQVL